ncbi:L-serine ammonia-lyase [Aurantimonas sp. VKM B-3413]|uniref:L-serine ammonia-lyase n=1 Tax=Aurantimonas sp. VKM B-3413 TaxID=2779401 RepID=UPI001E5EB725|nr:L-serine ammonia-lyase [Aurantimonas sp. VKM B-3413]MCB8835991.1 L-serine ammonia-lyase [Aurantimonas sp. VKM B-3413]
MSVSLFELFKIGIGPSSSHTVGPMWAARRYLDRLDGKGIKSDVARVVVHLYASLALTGMGHGTDKAIMLGLAGLKPDTLDPDDAEDLYGYIRDKGELQLDRGRRIPFRMDEELFMLKRERLPHHPNGIRFTAFDAEGAELDTADYYSVGGGFVVSAEEAADRTPVLKNARAPYEFASADALLEICEREKLSIADLVLANEETWRSPAEVRGSILAIRDAMLDSIERGCRMDGILPGGLKVRRRAKQLRGELLKRPESALRDPLTTLDWVNLYALAVNEENAAGGRVVTAPTNGAAGVIPAVLAYYERFVHGASDEGVVTFLATTAAIGALYKQNASISAAEMGCQGEVGVACSMAAAGLAAVLGGTPRQVENAAEIAMEHNLGLTCDPIGGLVQIPCIERNTMGAVKAINAARLALRGDGTHFVSLDNVIETMRQTGEDMSEKYKETALGGLAVNVTLC